MHTTTKRLGDSQVARKKEPKAKYLTLDTVSAVEGLTRKQLGELQCDHGLRVYEVQGQLMVEESELHAAIDRAKREVRL
jgi:hypothetical protein